MNNHSRPKRTPSSSSARAWKRDEERILKFIDDPDAPTREWVDENGDENG